jgi:hypothetical protein
MAVWGMVFIGTRPVSALVDSTIAAHVGVTAALLAPIAVTAACCALIAWGLRRTELLNARHDLAAAPSA